MFKPANKPILDAFTFALECFHPSQCEVHSARWAVLARCQPDPLWFVLWDPERVEYRWESKGYQMQISWVPGGRLGVSFSDSRSTAPSSPLREKALFGVNLSERASEVRLKLRLLLTSIPRCEAKRVIDSLDEVLTEVYERRTDIYALNRTRRSWPFGSETP